MSNKTVLGVFGYTGITSNQSILGSDVERVVNFPIYVSDFSCRMEKTLKERKSQFLKGEHRVRKILDDFSIAKMKLFL